MTADRCRGVPEGVWRERYRTLVARLEAWALQLESSPEGVGHLLAKELRNRMKGSP